MKHDWLYLRSRVIIPLADLNMSVSLKQTFVLHNCNVPVVVLEWLRDTLSLQISIS